VSEKEARKDIVLLTIRETIEELRKPLKESWQTTYTRSSLFVHLVCLLLEADRCKDGAAETTIKDFFQFIAEKGSENDKNQIISLKQSVKGMYN
jgi:hypothetical protein